MKVFILSSPLAWMRRHEGEARAGAWVSTKYIDKLGQKARTSMQR